jgi:hypothetical protein
MILKGIAFLLVATAAQAQTLSVTPPTGAALAMSVDSLKALPQADATLSYGNPTVVHRFQGPLLWTILTQSHAIDPTAHSGAVRQTLRIQGMDGYVAIIAMGELSPEFENKPALLALSADGKPLEHPRAIVTNDRRAGRSVRDVVSLTVDEVPKR